MRTSGIETDLFFRSRSPISLEIIPPCASLGLFFCSLLRHESVLLSCARKCFFHFLSFLTLETRQRIHRDFYSCWCRLLLTISRRSNESMSAVFKSGWKYCIGRSLTLALLRLTLATCYPGFLTIGPFCSLLYLLLYSIY